MPAADVAPASTEYLLRSVLRKDAKDPVAMPIGDKDSKEYQPRAGDFTLEAFYVVNHGRQAAEQWTLARLTQLPKLVTTRKHGIRWQCKVMLYAKNSLARTTMKFLPERRAGTLNGWETLNCQSLAFLALKLPGKTTNKELTKPHQERLAQILKDWADADESQEEEEEGKEEEDDQAADPDYADLEEHGSSQEEGCASDDNDEK